ncbi:MAG: NAD-dependent epimerase/dehydratase family protein [Candidatus Magasanikbacteria bacterium]|nr:NAD-dependent epimerase/dehydratase family protein [Candidatus Magasanikbacteria bacterium]
MDTPIFEKKNVLVTGGAGFIGSHLCERLLREAKVICVDNFSNSNTQNINHLLQYPDFEFINYDITKPLNLEEHEGLDKFKIKFQGIQEIYHLACPTSPKNFEAIKIDTLKANSLGVINTLELAAKHRAKYLFTSSAVVYGDDIQKRSALSEDSQGTVNQLSPRACYDEGKRFAETCVSTYAEKNGFDAKIARVFTTYGPRLRLFENQLIPDFIINALENKDLVIHGDKNFSTSLCFVSDMVDGLVRLMDAEESVKVVNLGGEEAIKYTDVAAMIINLTNSTSRVVLDKPLLFLTSKGTPNVHYAKETLGWFPLVRLEDGLRKTVDFVIANKEAFLFSDEGQRV